MCGDIAPRRTLTPCVPSRIEAHEAGVQPAKTLVSNKALDSLDTMLGMELMPTRGNRSRSSPAKGREPGWIVPPRTKDLLSGFSGSELKDAANSS